MHVCFQVSVHAGQHTHVPLHVVCMCRRVCVGTSHLCVQARVAFPPLLKKAPFSHNSSFFLGAGVFLQNHLVSSLPFGAAPGRCVCWGVWGAPSESVAPRAGASECPRTHWVPAGQGAHLLPKHPHTPRAHPHPQTSTPLLSCPKFSEWAVAERPTVGMASGNPRCPRAHPALSPRCPRGAPSLVLPPGAGARG